MNSKKGLKFQQIVILILNMLLIILMVFNSYRPASYNLSIGSVCNRDIYAPRSFIDNYQTEYDAVIAKNSVNAIFVRSEEISEENISKVETFFTLVRQARELRVDEDGNLNEEFDSVLETLNENLETLVGFVPEDDELQSYIAMSSSAFNLIENKGVSIAEIVMMENVNTDSITGIINDQIELFESSNPSYITYSSILHSLLDSCLTPNSVFDSDATEEAAENAYITVMNDPVVVEKGTKIVSAGDVITEHSYNNLCDLELIREDTFDIVILARIAVYEIIIAVAALFYMINNKDKPFMDMRVTYTLVLTYLIPVAASMYFADFSNHIIITLFFTTIAATYVGLSYGILLSISQILMLWPLYSFDIEYLVVSFVAVVVCASIASNSNRSFNSANLIIFPAFFAVLASITYNWLLGSPLDSFVQSAVWTGVSSMFATVIAIGLMPIYELFSNTVSPVKLIELSQPGHPLLKRLFIEASGTYHHSMMVANMADAAAEAVGADALLCKVASYYHDIGKLENPRYFTENQAEGVNPHDDLTTEESVAIITNHIIDGNKLAKHHKLPEPITRIIDEHHGTTYPAYFYFKAKKDAQEQGLPEPNLDDFKYKGHVPSSRESAIIMIADTCEAAIRSMKLTDSKKIEETIRDLIKKKIDQDQLSKSGLSFDDIEKIIIAFRQVYAGSLHERIEYPDEN